MRFIWLTLLVLICERTFSQVNLQMGSAEQSFPLINYTDNKAGLNMGVGLNYSSGNGLLVNEIASDVGTGWNFDVGGMIIRIQNGEPDDQKKPDNNEHFWAKISDQATIDLVNKNYPDGFLYNPKVGLGCSEGLKYYPQFNKPSMYKELNLVAADVEQDKFVYNVNGRSGVFVIDKGWIAKSLGDSKVKIIIAPPVDMASSGVRTRINEFTIITEDGIKYVFRDKSLSKILRYKYSRHNGVDWRPIDGDPATGILDVNFMWGYDELKTQEQPFIVNSWFLSEIENPNTGQKILFNYQDVNTEALTTKIVTRQYDLNESQRPNNIFTNDAKIRNGRDWYNRLSNSKTEDGHNYSFIPELRNKLSPGSGTVMFNRSISKTKRINNIILPNGGKIQFKYKSIERLDLKGERALSTIEYTIGSKLIRSYNLEYKYMFKTTLVDYTKQLSAQDKKFARLCLVSVQKIGSGVDDAKEPPYKFDYYLFSENRIKQWKDYDYVPAQNYLSHDHWGYYNGDITGIPWKNADHDFLNNADYFKAALPEKKAPKPELAKNGLLKSVTYPTGGKFTYFYKQILLTTGSGTSALDEPTGGVSVNRTEMLVDGSDVNPIRTEYDYRKENLLSSRWGVEQPDYHSFSVSNSNLKFSNIGYKYVGVTYPEMATSIDWGKVWGKAAISAAISVGIGVAMSAILAGTAALPIINIIVFVASLAKILYDGFKTYEFHRFMIGNINHTLSNPLPTQYSRVEVTKNGANGYSGKTVYNFTDPNFYPILKKEFKYPYVPIQRTVGWAYGLPKKITVFDKNNQIVSETQNNYSVIKVPISFQRNSCKCATRIKESIGSREWDEYKKTRIQNQSDEWLSVVFYSYFTGRTDLISTSETGFKNGLVYYKTFTNFTPDAYNYLVKEKKVQKDFNSVAHQVTYFPSDYNIPGSAMETMKNNNILQVPVSTETWLTKDLGSNTFTSLLVDASVTEYKKYAFNNGVTSRQEVKPWKIYKLKTKNPITAATIGTHNKTQLIRNSNYYKLESEMIYDNDGNLIQTISDDAIISYINDYKSRYVIAKVANAAVGDIAYSSFESDGTGSWQFNSQAIRTDAGLTGARSLKLGYTAGPEQPTSIVKSGLNAQKTYIVSFWEKDLGGSGIHVNDIKVTDLYEKTNGWKFCQAEVSNATQISISGVGTIDEVRLYPKGSLMTTSTYDEGIGKIADCDVNNRLIFYDNDALGRLKTIKDQDGNVLKTYEYNYKTSIN
jgi:hypothetical protein